MKINNINLSKISLLQYIPAKIMSRTGKFFLTKIVKKASSKASSIILSTSSKRNSISLPSNICFEPDDFIAIGLYFAEGEKYTNAPGISKHSGQISIANCDVNAIKIYCKLLNKLNISTNELHYKIGLNINFKNSVDIEKLHDYWISSLSLNSAKRRPKWIYFTGKIGSYRDISTSEKGFIELYYGSTIFRGFFLNFIYSLFDLCIDKRHKEELSLILKGFFAGDGCVHYSKNPRRKQIDFLNKDAILLEKLRKSLQILGLNSIRETWPERTKAHTKSLRIYNYHDFKILEHYNIVTLIDYKKETFEKLMKSYATTPSSFMKIR
jgi:hypothetical protein